MAAGALKELSDQQIVQRMLETERSLVGARFQHSMNQLENTARLRQLRRDIARLKTEARTREVAQGLPVDGLLARHRAEVATSGAAPEAAQGSEKGGFLSGIVDKLAGSE